MVRHYNFNITDFDPRVNTGSPSLAFPIDLRQKIDRSKLNNFWEMSDNAKLGLPVVWLITQWLTTRWRSGFASSRLVTKRTKYEGDHPFAYIWTPSALISIQKRTRHCYIIPLFTQKLAKKKKQKNKKFDRFGRKSRRLTNQSSANFLNNTIKIQLLLRFHNWRPSSSANLNNYRYIKLKWVRRTLLSCSSVYTFCW